MSFDQALSGLNVASRNLDVIGNNVANANTIGFKEGSAHFSDLFSSALSSSTQAGLGAQVTGISQSFAQGQINATSNPMDVAISGSGFFRMNSDSGISYSRDGEFQMDKSNYIVNSMGYRLTGFPATSTGTLLTGAAPVDLQMTQLYQLPAPTANLSLSVNLDSRSPVPTNTPFNFNDPTTYNSTTSSTTYDSLGNQHIFSVYYVKTAANNYNVYGSMDNAGILSAAVTAQATPAPSYSGTVNFTVNGASVSGPIPTAVAPQTQADAAATFINNALSTASPSVGVTASVNAGGQLVLTGPSGQSLSLVDNASNLNTVLGLTPVTTAPNAATLLGQLNFATNGLLTAGTTAKLPFQVSAPVSTGAATPLAFNMNMTGTTQFGSPFGVATLNQDGYASGNLTNFDIGADGTITGHYTNGQSRLLGQVALANFANAQGLESIGNNQFISTTKSGQALLGAPGTSSLGTLQSSALEESNVDLTTELVNMISAQRVYQANAESIKTQDQIMQTITNLR